MLCKYSTGHLYPPDTVFGSNCKHKQPLSHTASTLCRNIRENDSQGKLTDSQGSCSVPGSTLLYKDIQDTVTLLLGTTGCPDQTMAPIVDVMDCKMRFVDSMLNVRSEGQEAAVREQALLKGIDRQGEVCRQRVQDEISGTETGEREQPLLQDMNS